MSVSSLNTITTHFPMDLGSVVSNWMGPPRVPILNTLSTHSSQSPFKQPRLSFPSLPFWPAPSRPHLSQFDCLPQDVLFLVCKYLSVKDILALRATNTHCYRATANSNIWYSLLSRLRILHPVLPATSRNLFGSISSRTYEDLVVRGVYLTDNWQSGAPEADRVLCQTYHEPVHMIFLPGGRYLFMMTKNNGGKHQFALVLYDLHARMGLLKAGLETEPHNLKARYAMINGEPTIICAFTVPSVTNNKVGTTVKVFGVSLISVEQLSDATKNRVQYETLAADARGPFVVLHEMFIEGKITDLDLADTEESLLLAVIIAPLGIIFTYVGEVNMSSSILLSRITIIPGHTDTAWKIKLLPWQREVIVVRIVTPIGQDTRTDPEAFSLEMYKIPMPGQQEKHPVFLGRQFVTGLNIYSFVFSDLELSWFSAARNPYGLLNTPLNSQPPPISIYALTKSPSGVAHFVLKPKQSPESEFYEIKNGMGNLPRYVYAFPAAKIGRFSWKDSTARSRMIPGAFRSIIYTLPRYKPSVPIHLDGIGVQRFLAYRLIDETFPDFACSRTTGYTRSKIRGNEIVQVEEIIEGGRTNNENVNTLGPLMSPSLTHAEVAKEMSNPGTTAMAWDESTGKFVYAIAGDTKIRLLDFGLPLGNPWRDNDVYNLTVDRMFDVRMGEN